MKNNLDEKVVDFYFILYFMDKSKIEKSLSFFDLDHLKHESANKKFIHFIEEDDEKPIIQFTIQYTYSDTECYNRQRAMKNNMGYGLEESKRLGGGFIMYDLEHQKDALDYLKKNLDNVVYNKNLKYVLIGITENSNEKDSTKEKDIEKKFCEDNNLIFTGFVSYSFNKEQKWEFINDCINKIVGDEIKEIKEERKRKEEKRKREEEERKREEVERIIEEEERKRKREEAGERDDEDIEDFEEGFDLETGGYYGCK